MRTRWISFDCFGTLVDWRLGFTAVLAPIAGARMDELLSAYHRMEPLVQAERPHRPYKEVLVQSLLQAAKEIGLELTESQARVLPERWSSLPVFKDIEEMLATLRAAGYKLAVLTNCDNDLFEQTHRAFQARFDLVITAEQVQAYKPAPAHFHCFSRLSGAEDADWVHVGCSWFHDIAPARYLGIRSIWLDREQSKHDPAVASLRILTARELPAAIDQLFSTQEPGNFTLHNKSL